MIKESELMAVQKEPQNIGVKARAYEACRTLIRDGWRLIELEPYHNKYARKEYVTWFARLVKGDDAIYIEVSAYAYGMTDAQYQCPVCGHDNGNYDWCDQCDSDHIEPVLMTNIPADFEGGDVHGR